MLRLPPISTLFPYTTLFRSIMIDRFSRNFTGCPLRLRKKFSWRSRMSCSSTSSVIQSFRLRSEEHTSELQSRFDLVCRLLLEKKKNNTKMKRTHVIHQMYIE